MGDDACLLSFNVVNQAVVEFCHLIVDSVCGRHCLQGEPVG